MRNLKSLLFLAILVVVGSVLYRMRRSPPTLAPAAPVTGSEAMPSNPTGGDLWDSATALWGQGRARQAGELFALGATLHPADASWPQAEAVALSSAGDSKAALQAIERCRKVAPLAPEAVRLRRRLQLEVGFEKAGAGDPWGGRQLADAVLLDHPDDSMALLLRGYSWAMEGDLASAETALGRLVDTYPGTEEAYPILIQCALRRGDATEAGKWLARLRSRFPGTTGLDLWDRQIASLREGRGAFSSRLRVTCDGPCPEGLEREVLEEAERAWTSVGHDLGRSATSTVSIRLVDAASMPTEWAAAVYDGQIRIPLKLATDPQRRGSVLRHELSHAFLSQFTRGRIPLWLNEGLAQWLEGSRPGSLPDARDAAWLDALPSRRQWMDLSSDEAELAYAWSLAVTSELLSLHGSIAMLRYLDLLAGGSSEPDAFASVFGRTYQSLSARIRERM
ncbi:MAG: tetratricopeptide repeat protein [Fibrobacteria bacterium]|nr:tetratricopeptide repeat protein [Fibrobacteria bacterium]